MRAAFPSFVLRFLLRLEKVMLLIRGDLARFLFSALLRLERCDTGGKGSRGHEGRRGFPLPLRAAATPPNFNFSRAIIFHPQFAVTTTLADFAEAGSTVFVQAGKNAGLMFKCKLESIH